jgi:hypothetical protein
LRYRLEREVWWRVAVDSKFDSSWDGWCSIEPSGMFGWVMDEYYKGLREFSCHTRFEVGDGFKIRFWHNQWCRNVANEAFSNLFGIVCAKDVFVVAHLEFCGSSNWWNVSFARAAHD